MTDYFINLGNPMEDFIYKSIDFVMQPIVLILSYAIALSVVFVELIHQFSSTKNDD